MGNRVGRYLRISDDREGMQLGVGRQDDDTAALCARAGDTVIDTYTDNDIGASTRSQKPRPQYERLLADARAGRINKIVAYTSSRLTRRPREHEDQIELAEQLGVEFAYVASPSFDLNTAAGRRIARILAANDAGEAEDISERVKRQRQQAAAEGKFLGTKRPFGYEADGVTVRESEAAVLREMTERILAGEKVRSVARDLNRRGVPTSTGGQWALNSVRRVLRRPRNAGLSTYNGEIVGPAVWPAIIDESTWRAIDAYLGDPARRTSPGNSLRYLGAGLYLCGRCDDGTPMRTGTTRCGGKRGRPIVMKRAYRCGKQSHLVRIAEPLDKMVGELVIERLSREDAIDLLDDGREDLAPLHNRLTTVRTKLDELVILHRKDEIDGRQLALGTKDLRDEKLDLEARIAAAGARSVLSELVGAEDVRVAWEDTPVSRQQAVVADLMTVTVLPALRGRRPGNSYFDPDGVRIDWKR